MSIKACYKLFAKSVLGWVIRPFKEDILFFSLVLIFLSLPWCCYYWGLGCIVYCGYVVAFYYVVSYMLTLLLNSWCVAAKFLRPLVLFVTSLFCVANVYCIYTYNSLLSNDFVQIIAGTNWKEAQEFASTVNGFLWVIAVIVIIVVLYVSNVRVSIGKWSIFPLFVLLSACFAICRNSAVISDAMCVKNGWTFRFDEIVDLRQHLTYPKLISTSETSPSNIVVILGESFSKSHSSLYGYKKATNPLLQQRVIDGSLIVFQNVESPYTNTTKVFKYILNTNLKEHGDSLWYDKTSVIEVMNEVGYNTSWISNQAEKGMFDNLPSGHSKLCDFVCFIEENGCKENKDGALINIVPRTSSKQFVVYHLMGQHTLFRNRYPDSFSHFSAEDYLDSPANQRETLSQYDNATLYNDFVVNSIIGKYQKKNAVVFYFSDHALDIFESSPNYCGHARQTDKSIMNGKKIPFMIYVSPEFQKQNPEMVSQIRNSTEKQYCTDKFIFTCMDISGYRFADNDDVEKYSILSIKETQQ